MATVTPGITFVSGETVTPAKLNSAATPTISAIQTADISDDQITTAKIADGAVTAPKLASGAAIPAGAVMPFAMNSAPAGWLVANGDVVPNGSGTVQGVTTDFSALYAAVSTTFGAAGTLPDLRGYFVRGWGTNGDGTTRGSFGQKQADELKSHTHTVVDTGFQLVGAAGNGRNVVAGPGVTRTTNPTGGDETRPKNIAMLYCIKF